jgi:hypothetical protein
MLHLTGRGERVILDADMAQVYGVTTKALTQAIKRNAEHFPDDFAFLLTPAEKAEVATDCDYLARLRFSPVLANVINSRQAT